VILFLVVVAALAVNNAVLIYLMRERERELEDRWQGRLQKCDAILALAERAEQHTHEGLIEVARAQERTQDHLLAMERITTDPRVVQALR
jgi:hypothetical protein